MQIVLQKINTFIPGGCDDKIIEQIAVDIGGHNLL